MAATILTVNQVEELTQCIYVRYNFEGDFVLLLDLENKPFTFINEAHAFLRKHVQGCYWEVSTYEQALKGNGMRDNV